MPTFLEAGYWYFDQAAQFMDIPKDWLSSIKIPNITLQINLKVTMDNGKLMQIQTFRC